MSKPNSQSIFEELYDKQLSFAEVSECTRNLVGFFETLIEIDREKGKDNENN